MPQWAPVDAFTYSNFGIPDPDSAWRRCDPPPARPPWYGPRHARPVLGVRIARLISRAVAAARLRAGLWIAGAELVTA